MSGGDARGSVTLAVAMRPMRVPTRTVWGIIGHHVFGTSLEPSLLLQPSGPPPWTTSSGSYGIRGCCSPWWSTRDHRAADGDNICGDLTNSWTIVNWETVMARDQSSPTSLPSVRVVSSSSATQTGWHPLAMPGRPFSSRRNSPGCVGGDPAGGVRRSHSSGARAMSGGPRGLPRHQFARPAPSC
jgi:hypothetical protein